MTDIGLNLQQVTARIRQAAEGCGRDPREITLLAVSKTRPAAEITEAYECGQVVFGENYVQEGVEKCQQLQQIPALVWHFIGPLQSNKSRRVAEHFAWCHTLDRLKLAQRLNDQRPAHLEPLNVLLQVNISREPSKSGIQAEEITALAAAVDQLPRLRLRGLMAIPAVNQEYSQQLAVYQQMAALYYQLQLRYPQCDTLSLGMSDDLEAAICAGSTLVRIGTAIFGSRNYS